MLINRHKKKKNKQEEPKKVTNPNPKSAPKVEPKKPAKKDK